jgi:ornithine cyclodeaminase/alanine dehydrogenase-like protein (mu-crystallin family)
MPLFFTESDVERLLPMTDALSAVEEALHLLGEGKAMNRPRARVRTGKVMLHVMPGGSEALGYLGFKAYTAGPSGARFYFFLFDGETGGLQCILEADRLGQVRTGAATGVATRALAPSEASRVGILGTGWQAASQLEALAVSRPLQSVLAFSRNEARRNAFCVEMAEKLGVAVTAASSAEEVVSASEILVTATNARQPVLLGSWLRPGQHVNAIGSNALSRRELDEEAVRRASFIATDSLEQAKIECGDLAAVVEAGNLSWDDVFELSDVVAGKVSCRREAEDVTLFESQGLAIEDVAVAKIVYERGREEGSARSIEL